MDRTAPLLPMRFDQAEARTHECKRHGTTTLFAALEVATGRITADACYPRHHPHPEAIRGGTFTSVPDLIGAIRIFIDAYNEGCQLFAWTKIADQILAKADRSRATAPGRRE